MDETQTVTGQWKKFFKESEFVSIFTWLLFFPRKNHWLYYFVFSLLAIYFISRKIHSGNGFVYSKFVIFLGIFNLILLLTISFANYFNKAVLQYLDLFIVSAYVSCFSWTDNKKEDYLKIVAFLISFFSFVNFIYFVFPGSASKNIFFENPIWAGVISGVGVLACLNYSFRKTGWLWWIFLTFNIGGLFVARSKAAFLGVTIFSFPLIFSKNKKFVVLILVAVLLTFLIPNPIQKTFTYSLTRDLYAFDRINIWKAAIRIFLSHPLAGVGLANYSDFAKKYNFKQVKGPANFFKVPSQSHNDYLQFLAETGLLGAIVLLSGLFLVLKRILAPPRADVSKIIVLYIFFQGMLFNLFFNLIFLLLILFFISTLFEPRLNNFNPSRSLRWGITCFFIFIFFCFYVFPALTDYFMKRAGQTGQFNQALNDMKKAALFSPFDVKPCFLMGKLYFDQFKMTRSLDFFSPGIMNFKNAQRLNPQDIDFYAWESEFYMELLRQGARQYPKLVDEIIRPLEEASKHDPLNPFLFLQQGVLYWSYSRPELARKKVLRAYELEPEYVLAIYFLQKNFRYFGKEENFRRIIDKIRSKARGLKPAPGSYLFELYREPIPRQN